MRYYENLFIVDPNYERDRYSNLVESVKKQLSGLGGDVLATDEWGKKRLSYLINGHKYGQYVLLTFETDNPTGVNELENWMKYADGILAYLTVRLDTKPELKQA